MSFFKNFLNCAFEKDANEKDVYYPWLPFATRGYWVESEKLKSAIGSFNNISIISIFVLIAIYSALLVADLITPGSLLWLYVTSFIFYVFLFYIFIGSKLKISPHTIKRKYFYKKLAKPSKLPWLIYSLTVSLIFVGYSIWVLACNDLSRYTQDAIPLIVIGLPFAIVFFGLCAFVNGYMVYVKLSNKSSADN